MVGDLLYLSGHLADVDEQAIYPEHPNERIAIHAAWQAPIRIQLYHVENITNYSRFSCPGALTDAKSFTEVGSTYIGFVTLIEQKVDEPYGVDDATRLTVSATFREWRGALTT